MSTSAGAGVTTPQATEHCLAIMRWAGMTSPVAM